MAAVKRKKITVSCRNYMRHWFAYRGMVGSSSPTCRRCDEPNPNYRPDDDPYRGES